MWIFQRAYDAIKAIKTPPWWKVLMAELQTILIQIALQVGQTYIDNLKSKILSVKDLNVSNQEKFRMVFNYGKDGLPSIKDNYLNLLISALFSQLKIKGMV